MEKEACMKKKYEKPEIKSVETLNNLSNILVARSGF